MRFKKGFVEIFLIVSIFAIGSASIVFINNLFKNNDLLLVSSKDKSNEKFEEFPFMELTIPYLRFRDYDSSLGELREFEKRPNYTSYVTNYNSDEYRVNGYLTIPNGEMPNGGWPAIVFVHGYIPPTIYETTKNYVNYADYFARNGFVVFKIDLRGHGDSEGEAMGAYYSGDYVIDTLNAYSALEKAEFVNPKNIGLWGHSMAGNVTFRSVVASQDIPAIVIWAGAVYTYEDMKEFGIDDNSYRPPVDDSARRRYREELNNRYGTFDKNSDYWKKVVPTNYLQGVSSNLLLLHAIDDSVVNVEYSRNLVNLLEASEIKSELIEFKTGGHNIISPSYENAMDKSLNFFKTYLSN